ncbi:unnamed protein product [Brassica rapa]|uniref:Uncharacterized protein n=1 Tax=Brassica campestris TaxID=3711 RepID=A0A8D9DFU8_BRACM|nr:unnamed protein product [Brassica rapa]
MCYSLFLMFGRSERFKKNQAAKLNQHKSSHLGGSSVQTEDSNKK